ncbi:8095_t:CDS:2 [Diversispora eburnea]|uniref:8095_t:CDS:1 n=1 Tax=Diversispora eburnea TaxID=1213867 RepID=A0A9N9GRJ5_9GLOM|nr:8095_t:CDS:2 [Diversispora eburnea]
MDGTHATSIQVLLSLEFDTMPAIGLQVMLTGVTTQTVQNFEEKAVMNFFIEEYLGNREPKDFWIEMKHEINNQYLTNKTNTINLSGRLTIATLIGSMKYKLSVIDPITSQETESEKHILELVDMSILSTNRSEENRRSLNVPWSNNSRRTNRSIRGVTPRTLTRRGCTTLAQMGSTVRATLDANPIPNMNTNQQIPSNQSSPDQPSSSIQQDNDDN